MVHGRPREGRRTRRNRKSALIIGRVSESSGNGGAGAPAGLDTSIPNVARVYDYLLGGKDNFAADRDLGKQLLDAFPQSAWIARQNRQFMGRAVRYCAEQGVPQFLDVGSGLPTMDKRARGSPPRHPRRGRGVRG